MELRSDISKQDLAEAVLALMKAKPYEQISIQDIVSKAGFSRMAYYRNFKNKDEIIQYYLRKITNDFLVDTKIDVLTENLHKYFVTIFRHLTAVKDIGLLLLKNNLLHFAKTEFDKIFYNKAKDKSELYIYLFLSGGLFNVYQIWLSQGCKETPEELADMLIEISNIIKYKQGEC